MVLVFWYPISVLYWTCYSLSAVSIFIIQFPKCKNKKLAKLRISFVHLFYNLRLILNLTVCLGSESVFAREKDPLQIWFGSYKRQAGVTVYFCQIYLHFVNYVILNFTGVEKMELQFLKFLLVRVILTLHRSKPCI